MIAGCLQVIALVLLFTINTFNHCFCSLRVKAIVFVVISFIATVFLPFVAFLWTVADERKGTVVF